MVTKDFNRKKPIFINESNIRRYVFPTCCHAIPGDDALGFIDNKQHIEIHQRSCPVAAKLKTSFGNRIIDAKWDMHKQLFFDATLQIRGIDRIGLLMDLAQVLSGELNVNMRGISITCDDNIFEGSILLRIHDRDDMEMVIEKLKTVEGLTEIQQIK